MIFTLISFLFVFVLSFSLILATPTINLNIEFFQFYNNFSSFQESFLQLNKTHQIHSFELNNNVINIKEQEYLKYTPLINQKNLSMAQNNETNQQIKKESFFLVKIIKLLLFCYDESSNNDKDSEEQKDIPQMRSFDNIKVLKKSKIHFKNKWKQINYLQPRKVSSPLQFISKYPGTVSCPIFPTIREIIEYYYIKNVWVSSLNERIVTKGNYGFKILEQISQNDPQFKGGLAIAKYKNVLFLPFKYQWIYGHWLNEGLSMIISMPQQILKLNPVIITSYNLDTVKFTLSLFNLSHLKVVNTKENFVFGENVFMCKAFEDVHGFGLTTFPKMKEQFRKYFELDKIKPTEHIFINRKPKENRYFKNINEVIQLAKNQTNIDWKLIEVNISEREQFAKTFGSTKVLVIPAGSLSFNMLYMADCTGIVTMAANLIDYPGQRLAYFVNIWCITVLHHTFQHLQFHNKKSCIANPHNVVHCIKIVLYAVDNQKWPDKHELMESFNIPLIQNKIKKYGNQFIDFDEIMSESIDNYNLHLPISKRIPYNRAQIKKTQK